MSLKKIHSHKKALEICIGATIKAERESFNYSQAKVADDLKKAQSTISKTEAGQTVLWANILDLALYFNCSTTFFIKAAEDFLDQAYEEKRISYPIAERVLRGGMRWFLEMNKNNY